MRVGMGLATAAIVIGAAVDVASPAQAADDFSGTYLHTAPGLQSTWVVTPCGQDCAHVADSFGWSADAHPFGGVWRFVVDLPFGTKCNNDGVLPGGVTYKVDPGWNQGTFLASNPAARQLAPGWSNPVFFTLTRL
jgi:hypothetical protein